MLTKLEMLKILGVSDQRVGKTRPYSKYKPLQVFTCRDRDRFAGVESV